MIELLAKEYRVCALDRVGRMLSSMVPIPIDGAEQVVHELDRVVDTISNGKKSKFSLCSSFECQVYLVGHSQGGTTATAYATAHEDKLKAIILLDAAPSIAYTFIKL